MLETWLLKQRRRRRVRNFETYRRNTATAELYKYASDRRVKTSAPRIEDKAAGKRVVTESTITKESIRILIPNYSHVSDAMNLAIDHKTKKGFGDEEDVLCDPNGEDGDEADYEGGGQSHVVRKMMLTPRSETPVISYQICDTVPQF